MKKTVELDLEDNVLREMHMSDYTVTTQLLIHSGDSEFTVDVVVHCYPSAKRVTVEPIDKASIKKVV